MTDTPDTFAARVLIWPATIMSIVLAFSPIPTIRTIIREQNTKDFSVIPYVAMAAQCSMWLVRAYFKKDKDLLPSNIGVLIVEIGYMSVFWRFTNDREYLVKVFGGAVGLIAILTLISAISTSSITVSGVFAMILNILMFASPLAVVKKVFTTKSVANMPLPLSAASLACAAAWFAYALAKNDWNLIIPNGLGVAFGIAQLVIYFKFARDDRTLRIDTPPSEEVIGVRHFEA